MLLLAVGCVFGLCMRWLSFYAPELLLLPWGPLGAPVPLKVLGAPGAPQKAPQGVPLGAPLGGCCWSIY